MTEIIYNSTVEVKRKANISIPFDKLEPGLSCFLAFTTVKEDSLRSAVSKANAINKFGFKVIKHKEKGFFEVACYDRSSEHQTAIVASSPEAITNYNVVLNGKRKYPFHELTHGFSFTVPYDENVERSLRVACSVNSKKLNRRFICIKHAAYNILEIACCDYKTPEFTQSSPEATQFFSKE